MKTVRIDLAISDVSRSDMVSECAIRSNESAISFATPR
jgi:hypothetical protein